MLVRRSQGDHVLLGTELEFFFWAQDGPEPPGFYGVVLGL